MQILFWAWQIGFFHAYRVAMPPFQGLQAEVVRLKDRDDTQLYKSDAAGPVVANAFKDSKGNENVTSGPMEYRSLTHYERNNRRYPGRFFFNDTTQIPEVQSTWAVRALQRNTWHDFRARYASQLNLSLIEQFLIEEEYLKRARLFSSKTKGLLADELHRAQMYDLCLQETDVRCDKEMGYCLEIYLPYAYFAHLHGCLGKTESFPGSDAFWFFSANHEMNASATAANIYWGNMDHHNPIYREYERDLHGLPPRKPFNPARPSKYPSYGFIWPPFSEFYKNDFLSRLGRPIALVGGKYTTEWGAPPINTFAEPPHLKPLLDTLLDHDYIVVYKRPAELEGPDGPQQIAADPGDYQFIIDNYAGRDIILWQDMADELMALSTMTSERLLSNVLMLYIYANVDVFVMTQGGNAVIASLFDAEIFIYHAAGSECLEHNKPPLTDQYVYDNRWNKHGGSRFTVLNFHADLYRNLRAFLKQQQIARMGLQGV